MKKLGGEKRGMLTVENRQGKEAWLSGFAESSVRVYSVSFDLFIKLMNETETGTWNDQRLIEEREEDIKNRTYAFEHKLIEFYNWLKQKNPTFSDNTRKSYLRAIRSFFTYHRLDVKFTQQQKGRISKKAKPKRKYYDYTLEDIKKMTSVSKPKERYILLCGKELGLRASDFVKLKQGTFIAHSLDAEPPIPLGKIYTTKEGVTAKPFLGYDGREAAKQWLTVLKSEGRYNPNKPMLEISKNELNEILKRLTKRASVNTGNEKVRFHQLRVFLVTRLAQIMEVNRWKQCVGKEVTESAYVKPLQLREDYAKVLPLITVNSSGGMPKQELEDLKEIIADQEKELKKANLKIDVLAEQLSRQEKDIIKLMKMVAKREHKMKQLEDS